MLVKCPADSHGFFWRHRILLKRVADGRWVALTPDLDLWVCDLAAIRHDAQERNRPFTRPAAEVYACDPVGRGELDGYHRRAAIQARALGGGDDVVIEERVLVIAELSHIHFGEVPTAAEMKVLGELAGPELTARGMEDVLWAVLMLPEFQLVR